MARSGTALVHAAANMGKEGWRQTGPVVVVGTIGCFVLWTPSAVKLWVPRVTSNTFPEPVEPGMFPREGRPYVRTTARTCRDAWSSYSENSGCRLAYHIACEKRAYNLTCNSMVPVPGLADVADVPAWPSPNDEKNIGRLMSTRYP